MHWKRAMQFRKAIGDEVGKKEQAHWPWNYLNIFNTMTDSIMSFLCPAFSLSVWSRSERDVQVTFRLDHSQTFDEYEWFRAATLMVSIERVDSSQSHRDQPNWLFKCEVSENWMWIRILFMQNWTLIFEIADLLFNAIAHIWPRSVEFWWIYGKGFKTDSESFA